MGCVWCAWHGGKMYSRHFSSHLRITFDKALQTSPQPRFRNFARNSRLIKDILGYVRSTWSITIFFQKNFRRFFRFVTQFSRTNRDECVTSQQCHRLGKIIEPVKSGVRRRGGYIINKSVCRLTWTQTMSIKRIKSCLRVLNCLQVQLLPRITNLKKCTAIRI